MLAENMIFLVKEKNFITPSIADNMSFMILRQEVDIPHKYGTFYLLVFCGCPNTL